MHRLATALLCACAALPALSHAQASQRPEVASAATALQAKLVDWRRDIHQHPELGNRETSIVVSATGTSGFAGLLASTADYKEVCVIFSGFEQ